MISIIFRYIIHKIDILHIMLHIRGGFQKLSKRGMRVMQPDLVSFPPESGRIEKVKMTKNYHFVFQIFNQSATPYPRLDPPLYIYM